MSDEPVTPALEPEKPAYDAAHWHKEIKAYKTHFETWEKRLENVRKLYTKDKRADAADREYSLFWANIEVLKPAVYARPPVPVVAPRFKDGKPLASDASEILERSLIVHFEQADIDGCLRKVRDDVLMFSRGAAWVRGGQESVEYDRVKPIDFAHELQDTWREVTWAARRAWLTREEGEERFGEAFKGVSLKKPKEDETSKDAKQKAPVWEIWCRKTNSVYWVAEDHDELLDHQPPLFELRGFFPCPAPAYSTVDTEKLLPIPEIVQYKDQIEEVNTYTARIAALSESLRMKGFYAAGAGDTATAIETALKTQDDRAVLVPISSFAAVGGQSLKDTIVWLPVADIITLIQTLVELRRVVIEDVYQITGISDIVRGDSDARETLGAQQIKAQWGSQRIRERQQEIARFARDLTRITAEIMAENFPLQSLLDMSQVQLPTTAEKQQAQQLAEQAQATQQPLPKELTDLLKKPSVEEIEQFLRNDRVRGFVIEVETDSTIQPDEDAEKQRRIEFVTSIGGLFQQAAPIVMQAPQLGPFLMEVMKFAAAGFRAGRPLEQAIDELAGQLEVMAEKAAQPQEPQEDPQVTLKKAELALKQQESEQKLAFEQERHSQQMAFEQQKHEQEIALKRDDMVIRQMESQAAAEMQERRSQDELSLKRETEQAKLADAKEGREATLRAAEKPTVQLDAGEAMNAAAEALQQMANDQAEAMSTAIGALVEAVNRLGGPRRKTIVGAKGQRYEMIDEGA